MAVPFGIESECAQSLEAMQLKRSQFRRAVDGCSGVGTQSSTAAEALKVELGRSTSSTSGTCFVGSPKDSAAAVQSMIRARITNKDPR